MEPEAIRDPEVMERFKVTCELFELQQVMMRQNLRRRYPDETEEAIDRRFKAWWLDLPYDGPEPPPTLAEMLRRRE
jgi:hypothetical protein